MTSVTAPTLAELDNAADFTVALLRHAGHDPRIGVGLCCCCQEPRPMVRFGGDNEEWAHADDEQYAEHRHIHVDKVSRDCDGRYDRSYTLTIPDYRADDFHDLWVYVARHEPPLAHSEYEQVTIEVTHDTVQWSKRHEEGGESGEARICGANWCAHGPDEFRDHTAEAAGY